MSKGDSDANALAKSVIALLQPHTPFAEAIVRRQAERAGINLATLDRADMAKLGPMIIVAVAVFVDPSALKQIKARLPR